MRAGPSRPAAAVQAGPRAQFYGRSAQYLIEFETRQGEKGPIGFDDDGVLNAHQDDGYRRSAKDRCKPSFTDAQFGIGPSAIRDIGVDDHQAPAASRKGRGRKMNQRS